LLFVIRVGASDLCQDRVKPRSQDFVRLFNARDHSDWFCFPAIADCKFGQRSRESFGDGMSPTSVEDTSNNVPEQRFVDTLMLQDQ
jgi:hypothetical protein